MGALPVPVQKTHTSDVETFKSGDFGFLGNPVYGFKGGGKTLKDAGAVMADNLPPQKARILAMLALQKTSDPTELQKLFDR